MTDDKGGGSKLHFCDDVIVEWPPLWDFCDTFFLTISSSVKIVTPEECFPKFEKASVVGMIKLWMVKV